MLLTSNERRVEHDGRAGGLLAHLAGDALDDLDVERRGVDEKGLDSGGEVGRGWEGDSLERREDGRRRHQIGRLKEGR